MKPNARSVARVRPAGSLLASAMLLACFCGLPAGEARAAAYTWRGLGPDNSWEDTMGNWTGGPGYPGLNGSNDTVVFSAPSPQRFNTTLNLGLVIAGVTYNQSGFSLTVNSSPSFINGITATYETAPNLRNDGFLYFGGTLTAMNVTGTRGGFYSSGAPSTLRVLGSGTYYGHLRTEGAGVLSLTVGDGTHTASFTLANTSGFASNYAGATRVNANATLVAGSADALSAASAHVIDGTLRLAGGSHAVASLSGSGTVDLGASTLSIEDGGAFSGQIVGAGGGGIVKSGTGVLSLTGSSSYLGGTTIEAGTLLVEGSLNGGGLVSVEDGAIGGDGTIVGGLRFGLAGGIVFDATKTLTINGGTVTFEGFGIADVIGLDSTAALGTYTLLDGTAIFDLANVANLGAGDAYDLGDGKYAYFQSGSLDLVVVPEPASAALSCLGLGAMLFRRRSRR